MTNEMAPENTGVEETAGDTTPPPAQVTEGVSVDQKLSMLKDEIIGEFKSLTTPKPETKVMTQDEINRLWKEDPAKAIELAIDKKVTEKAGIFDATAKKNYYDSKAEQDFPVLKSDKAFQALVKQNVQEMIGNGEMTKDSPTLIYRASQLAALHYKKPTGGQQGSQSEMSAEAPTTGNRPKPSDKSRDQNFNNMAKIFGLGDKGKDYAQRRMGVKK